MAIISGVLMSKARKSLGNLTLATVKGRIVAKEKATVVSNPRTVKQVQNRSILAVCVLLWQVLGSVIKDGITRTSSYGSKYNRFVSNIIGYVRIQGWTVEDMGAGLLSGIQLTEGIHNQIPHTFNIYTDNVVYQVEKTDLAFVNPKIGDKLCAVVYSPLSQTTRKTVRVLTAQDIAATQVSLTVEMESADLPSDISGAFYFVSADGKISSSSILVEI